MLCLLLSAYVHVYVNVRARLRGGLGLHEGVWWQERSPLIGQIQGALKPFAYIWNF